MNPTFITTFAAFKRQINIMSTIILGIESSCDDTSAAVIKDGYLLIECGMPARLYTKLMVG